MTIRGKLTLTMALLLEFGGQKMGAAASFHSDQAVAQLCGEAQQLGAADFSDQS